MYNDKLLGKPDHFQTLHSNPDRSVKLNITSRNILYLKSMNNMELYYK
jgi:hypothetical protein